MYRDFNPPNVKDAKVIAYDTETTGLDWKKDQIVGHVIAVGPREDETFYFPVRHGGGANYDPEVVARWVDQEVGADASKRVVGHHLKFDLHFAANDGITFKGPVECTMVNATLIDENAGRFSLDAVAPRFGAKPKVTAIYGHLASLFGGEATRKAQLGNFWRTSGDDPFAVEYAAGDGTTTFQVWQAQQEHLDAQELRRVWSVECRCVRTLFRMERRGVPVDPDRFEWLEAELEQRLDAAYAADPWLADLNVRSPIQMKALMTKHGHTDWPLTPKGAPSFPEKWLETLDVGKKIIRVRKISNLKNTFMEGAIKGHIHNGRVHTTFNQLKMDEYGTVSGRLSSSEPNLQQVPKRDKEFAPLFRRLFVADPGTKWSANDYKQQEFVVFTEYTGNPTLVAGYKADPPIDMHQSVADMLGVERDPTAKRMNLGMVYGMGVPKLAASLGVPLSKAKEYRNRYDAEIPEARRFLKKAEARARGRGYVMTFLGRRRRFPDLTKAHKAGNGVIQGGSADVTKQKMVEIDEFFAANGDVAYLTLQVHDELDWFFPDNEVGRALDAEARRIMEDFSEGQPIHLVTPLRVDGDIADDWGKASFPKFDWSVVNG